MNWYSGMMHTAEVTAETVQAWDKTEYSQEEAEKIAGYMRAWDGIRVTLMDDPMGEGYCLIGWPPEEDLKVKEAVWLMEQDEVFGQFSSREEFDLCWGEPVGEMEAGTEPGWEPSGAVVFPKSVIEILETHEPKRENPYGQQCMEAEKDEEGYCKGIPLPNGGKDNMFECDICERRKQSEEKKNEERK